MDHEEFNQELEKLYESERRKEDYYLASLENERKLLIEAFYDHYASLSDLQSINTVDEFLDSLTEVDTTTPLEDDLVDPQEALAGDLYDLMHTSLERNSSLLRDKVRISGDGIFLYYINHRDELDDQSDYDTKITVEVGEIEEGRFVRGQVDDVIVEPMMPYEKYIRWLSAGEPEATWEEFDVSVGPLTPMIKLKNAIIYTAEGEQLEAVDTLYAPLTYESMQLYREIQTLKASERAKKQEEISAPVVTYFKGEFITGVFNDKENDLNYNEYDTEEFAAAHDTHLTEIGVYMASVSQDEPLILSAVDAFDVTGKIQDVVAKTATYLDSVMMKLRERWRVVHAFTIEIDNETLLLYILSENIIDIERSEEK